MALLTLMDMSLSKFPEIVKDGKPGVLPSKGLGKKSQTGLKDQIADNNIQEKTANVLLVLKN